MATLTSLLVISFALFFACVLDATDNNPVQAGLMPGTESNLAKPSSTETTIGENIKGLLRSGPSPRGPDDPPPRSPPPHTTIKDLLRSKHHGNVYAPQVLPAHTTTIKGLLRSGPSPPGDHPPSGPPPHTTIKDMQRSKHQGNAYANAPQVVPAHTTIKGGFRRSGLPKGTADAPEVPPTAGKSETVF